LSADRAETADAAIDRTRPHDIAQCLGRALNHLRKLQNEDGSFEGEVVWCPMILAQYVLLRALLARPIEPADRAAMILHFSATRRPDGGWGLHPESHSYVFVTTLAYVALRLLGLAADAPLAAAAREWLHAQPSGVLGIPSWGKFWLALAGLYDYEGVNPCPPEIFLLPEWIPIHPNRLYCHTRYIYLGISQLYGARVRIDLGDIAAALRCELYSTPYETIDFAAHRHDVAGSDLYVTPGPWLRRAWNAMAAYERLVVRLPTLRRLRQRALATGLRRIRFEQEATNYQALSPVNGILNTIALWAHDRSDPTVEASLAGVESWRWQDAAAGIRFAGARSNSWDTALAMQAALANPDAVKAGVWLRRAYAFLNGAQEQSELAGARGEARAAIQGGWSFSDVRHRWPVSDCTAEALSALLAMQEAGLVDDAEAVQPERLETAIGFLLDRQNADGGFGTYERRRGSRLLERLNPSEMFGDCMTELSYIECTAAAVLALARFRSHHPQRIAARIERAVARACAFLLTRQRADGSYPGFWGINFTYATWFAVSALRSAGVPAGEPVLARAAAWLISKQKPDGGWGEHHSGCRDATYVEHPESQAVMTSWAVLALIEILGTDATPVRCGIAWLIRSQTEDGTWPAGAVNGVFFGSAMLTYRLYPKYFPIWAINRYLALSYDDRRG
jgi:2,3-oxidosqualene cyclase